MNILLYKDIVRGAGVGHTFACYNYAVNMSIIENRQLVVPTIIMGHNLPLGKFEAFFGLESPIDMPLDNIKIIEYSSSNSSYSLDFTKSETFFLDKYIEAKSPKNFSDHNVPNKINISIHIRRGDILNKPKEYADRIISDVWYRDTLLDILELEGCNIENTHVNIYSEITNGIYYNEKQEPTSLSSIFDFIDHKLYMNTNIYECIYNMINSDIFIGGRWGIPLLVSTYRNWFSRVSYIDEMHTAFVRNNGFDIKLVRSKYERT